MPCPTFSDLEAFHSKSLSPERLDAILDHASTCDTCYDLLSSSMDAVQEEALGREVREVLQLSKLAGEPECTAVIEKILQGFLAQESLRDGSTNHHFLEAGSRFGDFRIKRLIARGGMGVVYAAEQISLERDVALKVLVSGQPLTDRKLQRFRNEALALARLDHHHIVPVLAFGEERGFNYLVMRLIEGIDLAKVIQQLERANPGRGSAHSAKTVAFKEDADLQAEGKERTVEFELTPIASDLTGDFEKSALEFPVDIFGSSNISDVLYIKQILKQFARLADALQYSHDRGIIHRD
ncbi:MAG: hypothetical protein CMJ46_12560, partial [Planctomyces sp.]|nr:hypothetical protein [Planctomyces sp.]